MGIEALSLDGGGSIDDLDLDFTLPGYPDIELKVRRTINSNTFCNTGVMYWCFVCSIYSQEGKTWLSISTILTSISR